MGVSVEAQADSESLYVKAVNRTSELLFRRIVSPWLWWDWVYSRTAAGGEQVRGAVLVMVCCKPHLQAAHLAVLHGFTKQVIRERRAVREAGNSAAGRLAFLDLMLEAGLAEEEVQENVDTVMFEGHDTTASSLASTLYLLATHPAAQDRCQV